MKRYIVVLGVFLLTVPFVLAAQDFDDVFETLAQAYQTMRIERDAFLDEQTAENKTVSDVSAVAFTQALCTAADQYMHQVEVDLGLPTDDPDVLDEWLAPEREQLAAMCNELAATTTYTQASRIIWNDAIVLWEAVGNQVAVRQHWLQHTFLRSLLVSAADVQIELRSLQAQLDRDATVQGEAIDWTEWELLYATAQAKVTELEELIAYNDALQTPVWSRVQEDGFAWNESPDFVAQFFVDLETVQVLQANTLDALYQIAVQAVLPSTSPVVQDLQGLDGAAE